MIPVVLDTNILMASLLKESGSNRAALAKVIDPRTPFTVFYSSQMADEYAEVLSRPPIVSRGLVDEAEALFRLIMDVGEQIVPKYIPALVYPDVKDRPFLEATVYVEGILLTNNLKDYPFLGVTVIGPDTFLDWCEERGL